MKIERSPELVNSDLLTEEEAVELRKDIQGIVDKLGKNITREHQEAIIQKSKEVSTLKPEDLLKQMTI